MAKPKGQTIEEFAASQAKSLKKLRIRQASKGNPDPTVGGTGVSQTEYSAQRERYNKRLKGGKFNFKIKKD